MFERGPTADRAGLRRSAWIGLPSGTLLFLVLAWLVSDGRTKEFDRAAMLAMRDPANADRAFGPVWFREAAAEWTALGGYPILTLLVAILVVGFLASGRRRTALVALTSLALGASVSSGLKLAFARPRPDLVEHLDRIFTSSFPSAHAMMSTVTFLTIAAMLATLIQRPALRAYTFAVAAMLAILVGVSRVYLGVHWPTDVAAGWAVGVAWASLSWLVADHLLPRPEPAGEPA